MIQIFGHPKCKVTRAAERFFKERRVPFQYVDIVAKGLSKGELESVARAVGGVEKLWDPQGPRAKERGLHLLGPSAERIRDLLLEDGKLYKTPIVRNGPQATVGADEATWKTWVTKPG